MPTWDEKLQKWGYHYYEEEVSYEWLGIDRSIILETNDDVNMVQELEVAKLKLDKFKQDTEHYDGRALSIAITHLETAMLWFANSRK